MKTTKSIERIGGAINARHPDRVPKRGAAGAFTLVEILVVIGIIAVIVVLAMGGYRRAVDNAQRVASMGHLKKLGTAGLLWSADHDGWSPPAAWFAGPRTNGGGPSILMPYGDVRDSDLLCPVADPRLKKKRATIQYGINYALAAESCHNANGKITNWGPNDSNFWDRGTKKLAAVTSPSKTVFFMATGLNIWDVDPESFSPSGLIMYLAHPMNNAGSDTTRRFNGKALIFWVDGHIGTEPEDWMQAVRGTSMNYESPSDPGKYFSH